MMTIVFENAQLLPAAWRRTIDSSTVRAFNPGIIRDGEGWLMAYRVVAEPALRRRIAFCRLDRDFRVIEGTQVPFSDWIRFDDPAVLPEQARSWYADPRLYRLEDRLFVYWNSGWHEPRNCQFLQEFDPESLHPIGEPRELTLRGTRQKLEKNWTLFECHGLHAVYSVNPHRILTFSLAGNGPIECVDAGPAIANPAGHAQLHGGLRGGSPPYRLRDHFYSFCHSIETGANGYRYVASVYRFAAASPFAPTDMPRATLSIHVPPTGRRALPKLNPAVGDVIYPAGAAYAAPRWVVSFGIDDERCGIALYSPTEVDQSLGAVHCAFDRGETS